MADKFYEMAFAINAKLGPTFKAAFKQAGKSVDELQKELEETTLKSEELADEMARLTRAYEKGQLSVESYKATMHELSREYRDTTKAANMLAAAQQRKQSISHLKSQFSNYGSKRNAAASSAVQYGMMAYAMAEPIKQAIQFESSMADVRKVVDFDSPEEFKEMNNDIVNLSKNIPMAAEGLARIVAAGGQAGIAKGDLIQFAEGAAKMGIAFDITADEAGDMMAKWRTAFKMNQEEVTVLADKINFLGNTTAASAPKISEVVTKIGPLGEVGGVASGEIAALGASIVGAGIEADVAATGIKNMILGLVAGESATDRQANAFEKLGLNAVDMAHYMQTDAKGAIVTVLEKIKALDEAEQASTLKDLFGKESLGAIAPLLANLDNLKVNLNKVADAKNYAGSVDKEYEARAKTTANALQLLKNQATALGIQTGSTLLPALVNLASGLTKVLSGVTWLAEKCPWLTTAIVGVAIGATTLAAVFSAGAWVYFSIAQGVTGLKLAYTLLKDVMLSQRAITIMATAAQWAFNAAMFLGSAPIWLIIAAITALIGVGYLLISNWDTVKAWFTLLWEDPKQALQVFIDGIYNMFGKAFDWLAEKWNWIKSIFSQPINANVNASASADGGHAIANNARGGIYSRGAFMTWFAEDSAEAAIPIDGSARAKRLWARTGELLGMTPTNGTNVNLSQTIEQGSPMSDALWTSRSGLSSNTNSMNVTYAPHIVVQGTSSANDVKGVIQDSYQDFVAMMDSYNKDKRRVSYA